MSESQFSQVLNIEVDQIMKAYQNMGQGTPPKITVIIAQKNHHIELFQPDAPDSSPPLVLPRRPFAEEAATQ